MVSPEGVISIKVITGAFTLACVTLRYFILRRSSPELSLRSNLSHFALFTACLFDFTATGLSAWVLVQEIKMSKYYSGDELDMRMVTPKNSEVGPSIRHINVFRGFALRENKHVETK